MLAANEIENTEIDTIVSTLEKHPSVTHIDLSNNPLSRTAAKKLQYLVQRNPCIQRIDLHGTGQPAALFFLPHRWQRPRCFACQLVDCTLSVPLTFLFSLFPPFRALVAVRGPWGQRPFSSHSTPINNFNSCHRW